MPSNQEILYEIENQKREQEAALKLVGLGYEMVYCKECGATGRARLSMGNQSWSSIPCPACDGYGRTWKPKNYGPQGNQGSYWNSMCGAQGHTPTG